MDPEGPGLNSISRQRLSVLQILVTRWRFSGWTTEAQFLLLFISAPDLSEHQRPRPQLGLRRRRRHRRQAKVPAPVFPGQPVVQKRVPPHQVEVRIRARVRLFRSGETPTAFWPLAPNA